MDDPRVRRLVYRRRALPLSAFVGDGTSESQLAESILSRVGVKTAPAIVILPGGDSTRPILVKGPGSREQLIAALNEN